jgi:hypothetical protein
MEQMICQSCAMPMTEDAQFGTNTDGSRNKDYCCYCFTDGHFTQNQTMEEVIETCVPYVTGSVYPDADAARKGMIEFFPTLKRWRKA